MNPTAILNQHAEPMQPLPPPPEAVATADDAALPKVEPGNDLDDLWMGEGIESMVDAVPNPDRFFLYITHVAIRRKVGSIIIPDTAIDEQQWTHGLGIVVKTGPAVYMGKKFEDMGLSREDAPKPGDLVIFESRAPKRVKIDGRIFLSIPDDAIISRPKREHIHRIKFTI